MTIDPADPIILDPLVRGDKRTITISGLLDPDDLPATFASSDVLRFTMKRSAADPDRKALVIKTSSGGGGITFTPGTDTATITILPADFPDDRGDVRYVWDVQLAIGGSVTDIHTLRHGTGTIERDVSVTAP